MSALVVTMLLAASPVSDVVVYPDRAQVVRTTRVACGPDSTARFEGLTPAAERGSFQATVTGGTLLGLTVVERTREKAYSAERASLEDQLRALDQELSALQDAMARRKEQSRLAADLANLAVERVGLELAEGRPNVRAWTAALELPLATQRESVAALADLELDVFRKQQRRDALVREQERLQGASARRELAAEVQVACTQGEARVALTYLVGGASWQPSYEARAREDAGAVELSTYATVTQATGEDWTAARLVLSTATPAQAATPPEIRALRVGLYAEPEKKVLVRRDEERQHAQSGEPVPQEAAAGLEARAQGLSVQLLVPEAATVRGDGTPVRLFVARQPLKATFSYRAVPKLFPAFYLAATLVHAGAFPLLPGTVDVYRRQGLVSRYPLERVARGARFELSFGTDASLRAERVVVAEVQKQTGLFGKNKRFRYAYRLDVTNLYDRKTQLEVSEPVPVSELDEVEVEVEKETTRGFTHEKADGVVTWKLELGPKEKRSLDLRFHVDIPGDWDTGGL